jgi:glycosyltransferase involved in cell wall biosynthesis
MKWEEAGRSDTMKVGFNARLLSVPTIRGWNRYTVELLSELPSLGVHLFLYADKPLHERHLDRLPRGSYEVRVAKPMKYWTWEQYWLPQQCAADAIDLLHSPFNFGLPWSHSCRQVLTLHDAIDQAYDHDNSLPWKHRLNLSKVTSRLYHWIARTRADRVITVSEHSKNDLIKYLRIPEKKISVIPEAASQTFHDPISETRRIQVRQQYGLKDRYVFYVGGLERRKNLRFLVKALAAAKLLGVDLVLAGGGGDQFVDLLKLASSLGIADHVRMLGLVEDVDLPTLYAEALCFVYPSEYEGFGLQLCEAMATGCPTLAARATSLPEVLGQGGETFSLTDMNELSLLLRRVAMESDYRAELVARARRQAVSFSWRRTAEETLGVYQRVL